MDYNLQKENVKFLANAFVGAVAADVMPHIDPARYQAFVQRVSTEYCNSLSPDAAINQQGLMDLVHRSLSVEDIGALPLPFRATINGYRCTVTSRMIDVASSNYIIKYTNHDTGVDYHLVVDKDGDCGSDENYSLLDIYPF